MPGVSPRNESLGSWTSDSLAKELTVMFADVARIERIVEIAVPTHSAFTPSSRLMTLSASIRPAYLYPWYPTTDPATLDAWRRVLAISIGLQIIAPAAPETLPAISLFHTGAAAVSSVWRWSSTGWNSPIRKKFLLPSRTIEAVNPRWMPARPSAWNVLWMQSRLPRYAFAPPELVSPCSCMRTFATSKGLDSTAAAAGPAPLKTMSRPF
mmetsp:Transcript_41814/g.99258  ORF Transcript_41814/g.99258 Transcript_41814/m.99258 type:complete len:210 (-) Transcript_41814:224-853(-)